MTDRNLRLLLLPVLVVGTLAIAGPALARGGHGHGVGKGVFVQAAATYIGITPQALRTATANGQTPAQVAVANGKTVEGLTTALTAAGTTSINNALAAGRITAAQAQAKLGALPAAVQSFINSTHAGCSGHSTSGSSASAVRRHRG